MCIRDRFTTLTFGQWKTGAVKLGFFNPSATDGGFIVGFEGCLLYTSDAADERSSVDLGGRRIIKKKNN